METGDSKMDQILELAGKEFKADISTMLMYGKVLIMKEKIRNMGEKLKLETMKILELKKLK